MACSYIEPCTWVDNIHCDGRFNLFVIEERLVQALRASMGYRFTAVQVYRGRKKKEKVTTHGLVIWSAMFTFMR